MKKKITIAAAIVVVITAVTFGIVKAESGHSNLTVVNATIISEGVLSPFERNL